MFTKAIYSARRVVNRSMTTSIANIANRSTWERTVPSSMNSLSSRPPRVPVSVNECLNIRFTSTDTAHAEAQATNPGHVPNPSSERKDEQGKNKNPGNSGSKSSEKNPGTDPENIQKSEKGVAEELDIGQLKAAHEQLSAEVESLKEKLADLDDRYRRALAETENVRARLTRQIQDAKQFGIQSFCKDLLEVADVLQLATQSMPKPKIQADPEFRKTHEGMAMTEQQLQKVFATHGLSVIDPTDKPFDPNFHEAMFEMPDEKREQGTVAVTTKVGYTLNGRVLRPAQVGVVKK